MDYGAVPDALASRRRVRLLLSDFEPRSGRSLNGGLGNSFNQLGRSNSGGMSQLDDVDEADVPLASLDAARILFRLDCV